MYRYPPSYEARCQAELSLGLDHVPAYASWQAILAGETACSVDERFRRLPLLTKADIRRAGLTGLAAPGYDVDAALASNEISVTHTSGTTDERVDLVWTQAWWDACERASWTINAHTAGLDDHPEAILCSPLSVGVRGHGRSLDWNERRLARFLFLNEYDDSRDWTDDHVRRMAAEMDRFQPVVLEANPTQLARFARRLMALGLRCHTPHLIVLTYEFPSAVHLRQARRAFDCPIASSYGCTEAGYVFMECACGCLHQNVDFVRVEFQPLTARFDLPGIGRIALTSLGNPWRVLLRFDVGDLVRLRPPDQPCACGIREGVVVDRMEGRVKDLTFDAAGRPITVAGLDAAVAAVPSVLEYRVTQTAPRRLTAAAVFEDDPVTGAARLREQLTGLYRTADVAVESVPAIAPEPSGKHRIAHGSQPFDSDALFEGLAAAP